MNTRVAVPWSTALAYLATLAAIMFLAYLDHNTSRALGEAVVAGVLAASPGIVRRLDAPPSPATSTGAP